MFNKSFNINPQDAKILGSSVIPFAVMAVSRVVSPILQSAARNAPWSQAAVTVPTSAQGTGYFVKHPDYYRR